ncbi:MAG: NAD(P)H-hydrate epimerase, partial [Antricoccus sp.]
MLKLYTADQVRVAEAAASAVLPAGALMQRAAQGLSASCLSELADRTGSGYGRRVAMLVGSGGNGGDALWAGSFLCRRGVMVTALLAHPESTFPGAVDGLRNAGGRVINLTDPESPDAICAADLVIDGLVGLGSSRGIDLPKHIWDALARSCAPVVSVDLPSGVNTDSGQVYDGAIRADLTVTFGAYKPAHFLAPARPHCGRLHQ